MAVLGKLHDELGRCVTPRGLKFTALLHHLTVDLLREFLLMLSRQLMHAR